MKINGYVQYDPNSIRRSNELNDRNTDIANPSSKVIISDRDDREAVKAVNGADTDKGTDVSYDRKASGANGDINEIAFRLRTSDGFSSIDRLDITGSFDFTKAYSDLEKDESLEQYQYFVGDNVVVDDSEDGIVIQKSGF
ncbi:MAG: hypothetical protein K6E98_02750 [Lachnospiraceae bacterium]|nr:hypothetical protein [Lachnospiraceae bacterium]